MRGLESERLLDKSVSLELGVDLELDDIHHNPFNVLVTKTRRAYVCSSPKKNTLFSHLMNMNESRNILKLYIELSLLLNDKQVKGEIVRYLLRSPKPVQQYRRCITQRNSPEPYGRSHNKLVKLQYNY